MASIAIPNTAIPYKQLYTQTKTRGSLTLRHIYKPGFIPSPPGKATCWCITKVHLTILLLLFFGAVFFCYGKTILFFPYPLQAGCKVQWTFSGNDCVGVEMRLIEQMVEWKSNDTCAGSRNEGCMYKILGLVNRTLYAEHLTEVGNFTDDLEFKFHSRLSNCIVLASSQSRSWPLFYDKGLNYCNLWNLVWGSGLFNVTGFRESTDDSQCTQYSEAVCMLRIK